MKHKTKHIFIVTESIEVILDGKKFLLEKGDEIAINECVSCGCDNDVSGGTDSGIPERYKNMGFNKVGVKKKSNRAGKKWMVLAKKGDKYKVVHGGDSNMEDFTQHKSKDRQKKFWDRMGGKNSAKAKDPFSPLYWHKKFGTW
jgi:hypothetical protein